MEEAALPVYFGEWLKRRRKELNLSQVELAERACCTVFTIRKIESGERRPSKQLAGLLAQSLQIPIEDQTTFVRVARGELSLDRLHVTKPKPTGQARPAGTARVHLPVTVTPFFGREPELAALDQLLGDPQCRLLTLVGPGGIGKTRLAIEVAHRLEGVFPDGVWFVPLAPIRSAEFLVPAIADALHFRFQDAAHPQSQLFHFLRERRALLVLDNAEHLLNGVGLFAELLESCLQVKLLVTSRERLNLLSEWSFEIQGLPVPASYPAEQFDAYSSIALFLQSARRVQAGRELRDAERQWVVRICQIVEGMPLGIELAAAWVGLLSCEEIAREIESNLDFLTASIRDFPERHRSLRATLDHSWNLLDGEEKSVLRRLSVFVGSFDREAAEKICAANLSTLSSLKDKSLLRRSVRGRFELHELIRQYAALRLSEDAGEDERVRDQHAIYYAQRLADWEAALKGARQAETLDEMAMEIDNLRQAWQRLVSCCDFDCHENTFFHPSLFRSSLFSLSLFFELRCRYWEAVQVFGKAVETLKAAKASATRLEDGASLDPFLGLVTAYLGHHQYLMHFVQAGETLEEALRLLEDDPSRVGKAQAQIIFAWLYQAQGLYHQAEELFQKSSLVFQEEGDEWWYTLTLSMLAWATLGKGYIEESVPLFLETLNRIEPGDLRLGSHTRTGLGYARFFQGDYPEAERLLTESLELNRRLENKRQEAYNQRLLGQVALAEGQREQAQKRFQECVDLLAVYGESPDLAIGLVYLGKGLSACSELEAAREKFQQAVQIGRGFQIFYLVYWGLVNLARISMVEGQIEKAVEMAAVLGKYSVESKVVQDDHARLLEELKARLSPQQIEAAISQARERSIESLLDQAPTS